MSIETELKYRVNKLPLNYDSSVSMLQSYFNGHNKKKEILDIFPDIDFETISTFRTRIIRGKDITKFVLTLKTKSNDGYSRFEYEKEISEKEYYSLVINNTISVVMKNRYIVNKNNYKFEFDEYKNLKSDLITCEVELDNNDLDSIEKEKENIERILEEFGLEYIDVTMDYRYKNSNITKYF